MSGYGGTNSFCVWLDRALESREALMKPMTAMLNPDKEYIGPIMAAPMAGITIRASLLFRVLRMS